jgi:nitrite reductase/ring-hydroxylating ferredoxin subunit
MSTPLRQLPPAITQRYGARLDAVADLVSPLLERLGPGSLKDLLSGTWQGHPLHPVLTDVTVGAWTSAFVLDVIGGDAGRAGADTLVGIGALSAIPTAASGLSDWADLEGEERRVGTAHAVGNVAATTLYALSWIARRGGHRGLGMSLSFLGAGVASAAAYLGGHLVYGRGAGVDVTTFDRIPRRYTPVMDAEALREANATTADLNGVPLFLLRRGDTVFAMHDRCTHRGGPLHRGKLEGDAIVCPWHGSCFRVDDGGIERGPATAPQPSYLARIHEGKIEVRAR